MKKKHVDATGDRFLTWLAVLFAVAVVVMHNISNHPWMLDDAFISFQYAENFVSGHGLVYNIGERVEGYTTFLWVILLALGKIAGIDLVVFSKIAGSLFATGTILLLAHAFRFVSVVTRKQAAMATIFLGTCGAFTPWACSGMEVTMFTFNVLLLILSYICATEQGSKDWALGIVGALCALTAMTRPEGLLIFGLILVHQLVIVRTNPIKVISFLAGAFAILYVPYFVWRFSFYGYLFPNTYYAKVGLGFEQAQRGLPYLLGFVQASLFLLLPIVAALLSLRWIRKYSTLSVLPLLSLFYVVYIVAIGGDVMPAYRFFTPIVPILSLMAALSITSFAVGRRSRLIPAAVILVVAYNLVQLRIDPEMYDHIKWDKVALQGETVGRWLKEHAAPGSLVATNTAGTIPFFSKLPTIDMLGMNDEHIAHRKIPRMGTGLAGHEKGDGAYVLSRNPDYIILASSLGANAPVSIFLSDVEIYKSPIFHSQYVLQSHKLSTGEQFLVYERKR